MADEKVKEKKEKKHKEPSKARRWFRDFFSELKKVTWPSFSKVVKQTGVVLMVTVVFLLVLMAFDSLFGYLYDLLVSGLSDGTTASVLGAATRMFSGGALW